MADEVEFPTHLMERVAHASDNSFFRALAFRTFCDFWKITRRYKEPSQIKSVMDWGCGCGRLMPLIKGIGMIPGIYGCDIDKEAIKWCKEHFPDESFDCISPYPPTPYPDGSFDLVFGFSVLTHLTKELQLDWMREVNRIMAPGGIFIATLHGEFAMDRLLSPEALRDCVKKGINDELKDGILDGVAPKDYYRGTFQTEEYTRRVYGEYFTVLEYIGDGAMNMQDIVVLRKCRSLPPPVEKDKEKKGFFQKLFNN